MKGMDFAIHALFISPCGAYIGCAGFDRLWR